MYGNEVMISFPDLKVIKCYNSTTGKHLRDIALENHVYSFAVHENFIFYTSKNTSYFYKHNLDDNTSISKSISSKYMDLVINVEDEVIYVSSEQDLIVLDMHELNTLSTFNISNTSYGLVRNVFYTDNKIYALGHAFDKNNATNPTMTYSTSKDKKSILFADNEYVVGFDGIYSRKSGERLMTIDLDLSNAFIESGYFVCFVKGYVKSGNKLYVGSMSSMLKG